MAFNFKKSATKNLVVSSLMQDREKISVEEIIAQYPNGITIVAFDMIHGAANGDYPVVLFAEDDSKFLMGGGKIFAGIVNDWLANFEGDSEKGSAELAEQGGCKIKFSKRRSTKSTFTYTVPEIL